MDGPKVLRKRYIPFETVDISGDELLYRDEEMLVTRWKAIKPRKDFYGGISFTFLKEGYKISRFYSHQREFLYWYCDIIQVQHDKEQDQYTMADLLVDIKVMPDGCYQVLDAEELADALERKLVTPEQAAMCLRRANKILKMIDAGKFPPDACRNYTMEEPGT